MKAHRNIDGKHLLFVFIDRLGQLIEYMPIIVGK